MKSSQNQAHSRNYWNGYSEMGESHFSEKQLFQNMLRGFKTDKFTSERVAEDLAFLTRSKGRRRRRRRRSE